MSTGHELMMQRFESEETEQDRWRQMFQAHKATPGTHYCAKTRQVCNTPYTCSTACKLVTANSDGSSPHTPRSGIRPTLRWVVVLIVSTALAALSIQHGARFFY